MTDSYEASQDTHRKPVDLLLPFTSTNNGIVVFGSKSPSFSLDLISSLQLRYTLSLTLATMVATTNHSAIGRSNLGQLFPYFQ